MESGPYVTLDPALSPSDAEKTVRLCEQVGSYDVFETKVAVEELGSDLAQRHDVVLNHLKTGGRLGSDESAAELAIRTNYFRKNLAYHEPVPSGIRPFFYNEAFLEAAPKVYDCSIVRPAIAYANLLVPGQELAVHTDVPEFRGLNRTKDPEWFLAVMHHSGLFQPWRIRIATAVAWFHDCEGGEFAFYPDGIDAPPVVMPVRYNTAVMCDADSAYHSIDRVGGRDRSVAPIQQGMHLVFEGNQTWSIGADGEILARYDWSEMRFSIAWKAHCFADERERRIVDAHSDDLTREFAVERIVDDLRERGHPGATVPDKRELALIMMDEYIHFPAAAQAPQPASD